MIPKGEGNYQELYTRREQPALHAFCSFSYYATAGSKTVVSKIHLNNTTTVQPTYNQPAFRFFSYQATTSSRTVVSKVCLVKRASHEDLDKTRVKVFPNFTRHHLITYSTYKLLPSSCTVVKPVSQRCGIDYIQIHKYMHVCIHTFFYCVLR